MENQQQKLRHLSELKEKLKKYDYPVNIITNGIKKALEIPQNKLRKAKEKQRNEILPLISTFNPNNPPVYNTIKNSVKILKRNNVQVFESIKFINSKRQPPNLKKLLTKSEFSSEEVGVKRKRWKQMEETAKICNTAVTSHCYYRKNYI